MRKQQKLYLGANAKMYMTIAQTAEFLSDLRDRTADISRDELELFGNETGCRVPLLYGGSVNLENAVELMRENIDGLFIGRSAWQAKTFEAIIRSVLPLWRAK